MTKQTTDQIKEKMRRLLEETARNEGKEPQSIGNPYKMFDEEENEEEEGEPDSTEKERSGRDKNSESKD